MTEEEIRYYEVKNAGTSKTKNKTFDKNGYLLVRDLIDPQNLVCEVPEITGLINYFGSLDNFVHLESDEMVDGSVCKYNYPPYKEVCYKIKKRVESIIGEDLYPTYYFDRVYYSGQELSKHIDRPSCEISVSINIRTNLKDPWPFLIEDLNENTGKIIPIALNLNPGDGVIYKGCERPHWREPMPGVRRNKVRKLFGKEEFFYHQIFFHYVLANGNRVHYAWDTQEEHM